MYRDIPEQLRTLIEPVVEEHGCELVDIEVARDRGQGLLRITVDSPEGDGRVPIERCVEVSREVETLLDAEDAMSGAYRLEVSSPGLDRLLGREKDFIRAVGERLKLRTRRPIEGRKRFTGRLDAVESAGVAGTTLVLDIDGATTGIPLEEVEKANTVYEFSRADFFAGSGGHSGSGVRVGPGDAEAGRGRARRGAKRDAGKPRGADRTRRAR